MNDELKSQLTALALDEVSAEERAAIEAVLAEMPEARDYAAETGEFCGLLTRSLAGSEPASLSDEQRSALVRQLSVPSGGPALVAVPSSPRSRGLLASWTLGLGAAAAAVLVANHLWREQELDGVALRTAGSLDAPMLAGGMPASRGGADALTANGPSPVPSGGSVASADQPHQVAEVGRFLNEGLGYYDIGDFNRARDAFNRVLALDPHHTAARQGLERTEKSLDNFMLASRDHSRAKMLREVDESWEKADPEAAAAPGELAARGAVGRELADAQVVEGLAVADTANRFAAREASEGLAEAAPLAAAAKDKADAVTGGLRFGDTVISNNAIDGLMSAAPDTGGIGGGAPAAAAAGGPAMVAESGLAETGGAEEALKRESGVAAATADPLAERAQSLAGLAGEVAPSTAAAAVPAAPTPAGAAEPQSSLARVELAKAPAKPAGLPGLAEADSRAWAGTPLIALSDGERSDALGLRAESEPEFRFREMKSSTLSTVAPHDEAYAEVPENPFLAVASAPLSTFSIDVDTAAYANVRRFLNQGQRPPKAAVRLEEMVNYFRYDYPQPDGDRPFSVTVDMADCPWQPQHRLARIGLQGKTVAREQRPAANLVFLVDVSGSMDEPNKLPLVRQSLHLLTSQLKGSDHVALVTYAGQSGVALPSTSLEQKESVTRAIDALSAGGSTNGASGIQLAYQQARQHFKAGGVNRVLLATDGDFNVGITNPADLEKLITEEARTGVFLSVLGYGMGNLKDSTMEMLADKGNGNYAYIDSLSEARKALGEQLEGTLHTIAKDVKVQIEFNPAQVRHYRLLGYENRMLAKEDFNDDKKDAGEIGAGHSVTALYEIVPMSAPPIQPPVDPLKYQPGAAAPPVAVNQPVSPEAMTVKLRYKAPDGDTSQLIEVPVVDREQKFAEAPADFKFAASVAMTGLLLKDSAHKGTANWSMVRDLARAGKGPDPEGYRGEFLQLVEKAAGVAP